MLSPEIVVKVVVELEICGDLVMLLDDLIVLVLCDEFFVGVVDVVVIVVVVVDLVVDVFVDVALLKVVDIVC